MPTRIDRKDCRCVGEEMQEQWLMKQRGTSPSQSGGMEIRESERLIPFTMTMLV